MAHIGSIILEANRVSVGTQVYMHLVSTRMPATDKDTVHYTCTSYVRYSTYVFTYVYCAVCVSVVWLTSLRAEIGTVYGTLPWQLLSARGRWYATP